MEQALILGRYRPLADIGEGGHGAVTLAFDTKMARRVAIKRIPLSHAGVRRLYDTTGLAEARTAAMLNHPNIVTVHEWDTDLDEAFLIMEHVDGVSLAELLDEYSPLDRDEAAAILAPICTAMSFAHDNGVLHLDLKPENVLVTRDGLVKVGDFGVASLTNAAGQAISAGGTLGYMPPEQLRGEKVDARTDVWSLGALAYEVLTGAVPFASDTAEGALYKAEYVTPPDPTEFVEALSVAVDEALLAALAPVPEDRVHSVEELAGALLPLLGDPDEGRRQLRELVAELVAEDESGESRVRGGPGLWDRLARREPVIRRVAAALACGWLGYGGMMALALGWPTVAGGAALAALAAAFAPQAGLAAGLIMLGVGGFSLSPVLGAVILAGGALWWVGVARRGGWEGFSPFFAPLFAVAGVAPALPLLLGFFLPGSWLAVAAGGMAGFVGAVTSASAGGTPLPPLLGAPAYMLTWPLRPPGAYAALLTAWPAILATTLAWAAAAGLASWFASRATRPAAAAGLFAGWLITFAAVGPAVTDGQHIGGLDALRYAASLILVLVVIALGPPVAAEGDD